MIDELIWDRKPAAAEYRLAYTFATLMAEGDKLVAARVEVKSGDVSADRFEHTNTELKFWVSGGTPGRIARLDMIGLTESGETLVAITKMAVD